MLTVPVIKRLNTLSTAHCEGCNAKLLVGIVPDELLIPVPGINVWCVVPSEQRDQPSIANTNNDGKKLLCSNALTLCLNCFNAYGTGKLQLSLETLRILTVRATYTDEEKHLKIGGPTKYVKILPDNNTASKIVTTKPSTVNDIKIIHENTSGRSLIEIGKRRKISEVDVDGSKVTVGKVTESRVIVVKPVVEEKREEKRIKVEVAVAGEDEGGGGNGIGENVNYLSVGTGFLGAVEMTDDDC